ICIAKKVMNKRLTVITNSLIIADLFSASAKKLILLGGEFDASRRIFIGKTTELSMLRYYFDKAFVSCESIHTEHGITDSSELNAQIRRLAIERSNKTYLAVDNTKFNKTSIYFISELDKITSIITDKPLSSNWVSALKQHKVNYIIAEK
ncbi:MAG: DeoR/GlpR family DNA-binding transcription regulator, partial [Clostridia bacterium]|nr:DeoR/GlpR family DNA-binding transcription regulator [Clostridia bacterium]